MTVSTVPALTLPSAGIVGSIVYEPFSAGSDVTLYVSSGLASEDGDNDCAFVVAGDNRLVKTMVIITKLDIIVFILLLDLIIYYLLGHLISLTFFIIFISAAKQQINRLIFYPRLLQCVITCTHYTDLFYFIFNLVDFGCC